MGALRAPSRDTTFLVDQIYVNHHVDNLLYPIVGFQIDDRRAFLMPNQSICYFNHDHTTAYLIQVNCCDFVLKHEPKWDRALVWNGVVLTGSTNLYTVY